MTSLAYSQEQQKDWEVFGQRVFSALKAMDSTAFYDCYSSLDDFVTWNLALKGGTEVPPSDLANFKKAIVKIEQRARKNFKTLSALAWEKAQLKKVSGDELKLTKRSWKEKIFIEVSFEDGTKKFKLGNSLFINDKTGWKCEYISEEYM